MNPLRLLVIAGALLTTSGALASDADADVHKVPPTGARRPDAIAGIWDVEQVAVDGQDQMHWGYRPNDPQFMGRTLVIDGDEVRFSGSKLNCKQTKWSARKSTWTRLLGAAFPRPPGGGRRRRPTPGDFDLKVAADATAIAYPICGSAADKPGSSFPDGQWVAVMPPNRLALRIGSAALLVLSRRPPEAKPTASFPCGKAATSTEKAICGDFALGSWDRSVSLAWHEALERMPAKEDDLRASQEKWLHERNACGSERACLENQMIQRVRDLVRE